MRAKDLKIVVDKVCEINPETMIVSHVWDKEEGSLFFNLILATSQIKKDI